MNGRLCRIIATVFLALLATAASVLGAPVVRADFSGGQVGSEDAGWKFSPGASVREDPAAVGGFHLRCDVVDAVEPSYARLGGISLKPDMGYAARFRFLVDGGGSHLTFGLLKSGDEFLASLDTYAYSVGRWTEGVLLFRTDDGGEHTLHVGRRYGRTAILFYDITIVEDPAVRIGDVSPTYPMPATTDAEQARGFLLSTRPWTQIVYPTFRPAREDIVDRVSGTLAPDEYQPAVLLLTALRPLEEVRMSLQGDLQGPGSAVLPAEQVDIGMVRTITRWLTNSAPLRAGQRYERRPLFIFPNAPSEVAGGETHQWWLTVHAPPGTRPGTYRGMLEVSADGVAHNVPLQVRVLPIELAKPDVTYGMYYRHYEQFPEFVTEEFFKRSAADMRAHGMNSFSFYTRIGSRQEDGSYAPDFDYKGRSYSLNRQMQLLQEVGFDFNGHPQMILDEIIAQTGDIPAEDRVRLVEALQQRCREEGWPEFLFYLVDEPSSETHIYHAKRLNDMIRSVPLARTVTAFFHNPGELMNYYDVWILLTFIPDIAGQVRQARAMGREAWSYNCQWNGSRPLNDRYHTGLYTWVNELKGNWQWCYTEQYSGRMLPDGQIESATQYYPDPWRVAYVLPTPNGNYPTLGWEGKREGIDDYRYLLTLEQAIAASAGTPDGNVRRTAAEAGRFLRDLRQKARHEDLPRSPISYVFTYDTDFNPNLTHDDYNHIRARAAEYILQLTGH